MTVIVGDDRGLVAPTAIVHVRQPTPTSCAPACVAMLTGVDVHDLIREMKPTAKSGTPGGRIVRTLRDHGVRCADRFVAVRGRPFPRLAIIRIAHAEKRSGHVVVRFERKWFDPLLNAPFFGEPPRGAVMPWTFGSRITSALWIDDGMPA